MDVEFFREALGTSCFRFFSFLPDAPLTTGAAVDAVDDDAAVFELAGVA